MTTRWFQTALLMAVVVTLWSVTPTLVSADGPHGKKITLPGKPIGSVTKRVTYLLTNGGQGGLAVPNASVSIPGGGYAWAQAGMSWTHIWINDEADTGLNDAQWIFGIRAQATGLFKNGVWQAGNSTYQENTSASRYDTVSDVALTVQWVCGSSWRGTTSHRVWGNGIEWDPNLEVSANPC